MNESDLIECWLSSSEDDIENEGGTPSRRVEKGKGTWYQKRSKMSGDHCDDNNESCDSNDKVGSCRGKQQSWNRSKRIDGVKKKAVTPWNKLCSADRKPKRRKRKAKYVWETKEKKGRRRRETILKD